MNASTKADVSVPEGYTPSDDEKFMNPIMAAFFKKKLLDWREDIVNQTKAKVTGENR